MRLLQRTVGGRTPSKGSFLFFFVWLSLQVLPPQVRADETRYWVWWPADLVVRPEEVGEGFESVEGFVFPAIVEGHPFYPSRLLDEGDSYRDRIAAIRDLRKKGFKCAVYMQVFTQGGPADPKDHPAERFPEWLSFYVNKDSTLSRDFEDPDLVCSVDGFFFDPGVPRLCEFLLGLVAEVLEVYAPDRIILDQIAYPIPEPAGFGCGRWEQPFGYHPVSRSRFEKVFSMDPLLLATKPEDLLESQGKETVNALRKAWDEWRRSRIDDFLQAIRDLLGSSHPECRLGVVGYPDPEVARRVAMQDWLSWLKKDRVDCVILPVNDPAETGVFRIRSFDPMIVKRLWVATSPEDPGEGLTERFGNRVGGVVLFDMKKLRNRRVEIALFSGSAGTSEEERVEGGETSPASSPTPLVRKDEPIRTLKALYGFDPQSPPFKDLTPNQIVEKLRDLGFNAVFGGSEDPPMRRALDIGGIKRFEEIPLFVGEKYWKKRPESQPIARNGRRLKKKEWYAPVCPNQPWLRAEKIQRLLSRVVSRDLHGIWLDFIRYPLFWEEVPPFLAETCFCPVCLKSFQEATGIEPAGSTTREKADRILEDHAEQWYRWRADSILEFVEAAVSEVKKISPSTIVGAFVLPWSEDEYDRALYRIAGQDLRGFAERVDVLSPMLYFHQLRRPADWVADRIRAMSGNLGTPVLPILQCYDLPDPIPPDEMEKALRLALQSPSNGVILFSQRHIENTKKWDLIRKVLRSRDPEDSE